jgi:hypothetical protein
VLRAETHIGRVFGGFLLVGGAGAVAGNATLAAAACQCAVHRAGDGMDRGVIRLMAIEALALGSLRVGEHPSDGKQKCAAQEVKSTAVSGHFLLLLHLEVGFVA